MRRLLIPLCVVVVWVTLPTMAEAQMEEGEITVIQPRPFLRQNRVELAPRFGATINDPILQQFHVGGSLGFGISERVFIQGSFDWYDLGNQIGGVTQAYEDIIQDTLTIPELATITYFATLDVGFAPAYGKLVLFNRVIGFFDIYTLLGAGVVESDTPLHAGWAVGIGTHLYFSRWGSLNLEFRDRMSIEELPSGNILHHSATVSLGIGIYLPFNFRYTYQDDPTIAGGDE